MVTHVIIKLYLPIECTHDAHYFVCEIAGSRDTWRWSKTSYGF